MLPAECYNCSVMKYYNSYYLFPYIIGLQILLSGQEPLNSLCILTLYKQELMENE